MLCRRKQVTLVSVLGQALPVACCGHAAQSHMPFRSAQDNRQVTAVSLRHVWLGGAPG